MPSHACVPTTTIPVAFAPIVPFPRVWRRGSWGAATLPAGGVAPDEACRYDLSSSHRVDVTRMLQVKLRSRWHHSLPRERRSSCARLATSA